MPFAYAYDRETDSFSIRDDEAKVALELKDTYLRTHSLTYTARLLNGTGRHTRRGYAWTPATVAIILRSPFYRGTYRYNYRDESDVTFSFKAQNEWILCAKHHPPLFSEADCRQVDYWLDKNRRHHGKATHVQRKHVHIFAGLIRCGVCGSNYAASADRARASGYQPSMYNCGGRRQKGTCKNRYVNDITIGGFVFNYISNVIRLRTASARSGPWHASNASSCRARISVKSLRCHPTHSGVCNPSCSAIPSGRLGIRQARICAGMAMQQHRHARQA